MMDSKTFNNTVARRAETTPTRAAAFIQAFTDILHESAKSLDAVAIPSFGNFVTTKADEEVVVDRTTGRRLLLPPQVSVEFVPAAMLRKRLTSHE